ncbi:MAG: hypothetical protein EA379_00395 [Phycisphaerales bacterium]|nr:MAG: hypothetical protein EA379_00395 [Phycisphaerales bacterium]
MCAIAVGALAFVAGPASATTNLIGFNFTTAAATTPDPQNWNRVSFENGVLSNAIDDTGAVTGVNLSVSGTPLGGLLYLSTSTLAPNATPQHSYDLSGMVGYGFRAGESLSVTLSGLKANDPYEFWFVAYRGGGAIDNLVRVSNGDVMDAFNVAQQVAFADNDGRFLVNSTLSSDTQQWNDLSLITNASSNGTITFNWAAQTQTPVIGALAIRWVPAPGPVALLAMGGLVAMRRRR